MHRDPTLTLTMASVTQTQGVPPHLLSEVSKDTTTGQASYEPRDVKATVCYLQPNADGSPPAPDDTMNLTTADVLKHDYVEITVKDIRGSEDQYTLDKTGFQIVKHQTAIPQDDFYNLDKIRSDYWAECEEVLKKTQILSICPH